MTIQTILVVEDDTKIRHLLRNVFEDEGFRVLEAATRAEVLKLLASEVVSLMTLDIHLGADNGLEVAREIRRVSQVPIVMVTGKDDVIDRVVGLEIGADDYITKPFHVREVIARVRTVLRRSSDATDVQMPSDAAEVRSDAPSHRHFSFDGMVAMPDRLELLDRDGTDCGLTSGDFRLLSVFLERPKRVLSRDQLMNLTGGLSWNPMDRTIDNQIARLRRKIEHDPSHPKLIKTVRGVGYTFACDVQAVDPSAPSVKRA